MSQRTIVEFNHDFGGAIDRDPEGFVQAIRAMINGGATDRYANEHLRRYGVTASPTCHHSGIRKVVLATERGHVFHEQDF